MAEMIQRFVQDFFLSVLGLIGGIFAICGIVAITRRFLVRVKSVGLAMLFSVAVAAAVMFGGAKTNELLQAFFPFVPQVQQIPLMPTSLSTNGVPVIEATSPRASATMPFRAEKWNVRGAWNDSFRYAFDDGWEFPFGTGHIDRVEVCSQGRVIPRYGSTDVIASVGVPLEIVNPTTSFGSERTDRNSYIFSWTNAVVGRVLQEDILTAETIDASIELFRNGDVWITTNGVTELIPRIHPSDIDGDGIPDEIDPNPSVCDGDFFGPCDELPDDANTNAYCWVDIVVLNADAEVVFTGDGPSDLPDPHFMARACTTNRVTVLIGKGYDVQADEAIECVGVSDPAVEVVQTGAESLHVRWPVEIGYEDDGVSYLRSPGFLRDGGSGVIVRTFSVLPGWLGGYFEWTTNHCCEITMYGNTFVWDCLGGCGCGGCEAHGWYVYEGYSVAVFGGECGCEHEPTPSERIPSVGVSFSEDALFYEEAYTNSPGDVVGRRVSTNATLTCSAYGGPYGGVLDISQSGFSRLVRTGGDQLPEESVTVAPLSSVSYSVQYESLTHSESANDIKAVATFSEHLSGDTCVSTASLTAVQIEITPQVSRAGFPHRHKVGVREALVCMATPDVGGWDETGGGEFLQHRGHANYLCPITDDGSVLSYRVGTSRYQVDLVFIEPTGIVARSPVAYNFHVPENSSGGVGMGLDLYVQPETVSFAGIAMEEIPSTEGLHQGYFSNVYFADEWYHTTEMHAGRWIPIKPDNLWETDHVMMGGQLPRELSNGEMTYDPNQGQWSAGLLVWDITWGWTTNDCEAGAVPVRSMPVHYNQTFHVTSNGTLTVTKFGNAVSRETNCVFRLNGVIVDDFPNLIDFPFPEEGQNEN